MKRGALTLAIAGMALVLTLPAASAETIMPGGLIQLAQASNQVEPAPAAPDARRPRGDEGKARPDRHRTMTQRTQEMCESADAHHVATLAFSEARLKLTPAQKPTWAKFVEAATAAHQGMIKLMCTDTKGMTPPTTLPARLARDEQMAQARLSHIQTLRPALEDLYKSLTPEQQKTADTLPLGGPGHGRGSHRTQQGW